MIRSLIREQFLRGNTSEHDVYVSICTGQDWEDTDELYELFKAEYDAVIESEWWEKVQRERKQAEWFDDQMRKTDRKEQQLERSKFVRKYG